MDRFWTIEALAIRLRLVDANSVVHEKKVK